MEDTHTNNIDNDDLSEVKMNSANAIVEFKHDLPNVWSNQLATIKSIYGKNLNEGEWQTFVNIGRLTGLNPFLREMWAVKYGSEPAQIFVGRDGYRRSAQANKDYDYHHVDSVYDNDDFSFDLVKGEVIHKYNIKGRGNLIGAYCLVKKHSASKPIFVFVEAAEYNKGKSVWKEKPATMIKKVAEAQGLRMAFQELFGGTYDESENWINEPIKISKPANEINIQPILDAIDEAESIESLRDIYEDAKKKVVRYKNAEAKRKLIAAKDKKLQELKNVEEFTAEIIEAEKEELGEHANV